MRAAQAILTARGGMTSHAALVARGWGKCYIVGCGALNINPSRKVLSVNGKNCTKETGFLSMAPKAWSMMASSVCFVALARSKLIYEPKQ